MPSIQASYVRLNGLMLGAEVGHNGFVSTFLEHNANPDLQDGLSEQFGNRDAVNSTGPNRIDIRNVANHTRPNKKV